MNNPTLEFSEISNPISVETEINWHDGVLESLVVDDSDREKGTMVILKLDLYESHSDRQRKKVKLDLDCVQAITTRLDFVELSDNRGAGSISYGYFKKGSSKSKIIVLWLYLIDGFLEVHFKSGRISAAS